MKPPAPNPEQRFLCPHCRQKLACEDGYAGWRIQCPSCNGGVVVPLRTLLAQPNRIVLPPGALSTSTAPPGQTAKQKPVETFVVRFFQAAGLAFGSLAATAIGVLAVFGLLAGACGACDGRRHTLALMVPFEIVLFVGFILIVFLRFWNRLWD